MPLVYAGVVPHAPLLIPTIAKEHDQLLATTRTALADMAQELHARQADIVIVVTPHGSVVPGAISVNVADRYQGQLKEFGDIRTTVSVAGAPAMAQDLKQLAEKFDAPMALQSGAQLDYGSTVPIFFLQSPGSSWRLMPISVAGQSVDVLLRFGAVLHEFFHESTARIALIASADLERRERQPVRRSDTASDQRPTAAEKQIAVAITNVDPSVILGMAMPKKGLCDFEPIITFLASLQPTMVRGQTTSFSAPFGVGQMTATIDTPS